VSVIKLQRRLLGGPNRVDWRAQDWERLARHFNYSGPIAPLLAKRAAAQVHVSLPEVETRTEGSMLVYTFTISTEAIDHMLDKISAPGWNLSINRSNPVVQYAHNGDALPVGRALWTGVEGGRLKSKMVFSSDSFAQRVRKMVDERVLRGASVGFVPGQWEFAKEPHRSGGINFTSGHQLLEWSICNIPANPQCLFERVDDEKSAEGAIETASRKPSPQLAAMEARLAEIKARASRL
jgi:hypothetical protein